VRIAGGGYGEVVMFRTMLAAVVGVALLFGACGGDDGGSKAASTVSSADPIASIPQEQIGRIVAVLAGSDWHVGVNNFVFGITNIKNEPQNTSTVSATFYDLKDQKHPKPLFTVAPTASAPNVGPAVVHTHTDGAQHTHGGPDDGRVGYYAKVTFDHPGFWGLLVQATLKDGTVGASSVAFQVADKPLIPVPGDAAVTSKRTGDNLTRADVKDIHTIDSGDPVNGMHDVKIKDAVAKGRPLLVVFATPAYCISLFCGPVTEEMDLLRDKYKDKVDFVHIEIWQNFDKKQMNPVAKQWLEQPDGSYTEPVVYVIDKAGMIYDRWEGPVSGGIVEAAVQAVAAGKTFK